MYITESIKETTTTTSLSHTHAHSLTGWWRGMLQPAVLYFSVPPADSNVLAAGRETAHYIERMVMVCETGR